MILPITFEIQKQSVLEKLRSEENTRSSAVKFSPSISDIEEFIKLIDYPESAREKGIDGLVLASVIIDEEGKPSNAKIIHSDATALNKTVEDAVLKYNAYTPAIANDKPMSSHLSIPVIFELTRSTGGYTVKIDTAYANPFEKEPDIESMQDLMNLVVYPFAARRAGIEGAVILTVLIDEEGKAIKCRVLESDNSNLNSAAKAAVMKYRGYKPAIQNGSPTPCWLVIPINFALR